MYIVYCTEFRATALFDDNSPTSRFHPTLTARPHSFTHTHSTHSTPQLIVKVDTEVRRKSHLSAARLQPHRHPHPQPHRIALYIPLAILTFTCCSGSTLCVFCVCVAWTKKFIDILFSLLPPPPTSQPLSPRKADYSHWAAWRVNAESYVIIKIILRDCVDFFLGHLPE